MAWHGSSRSAAWQCPGLQPSRPQPCKATRAQHQPAPPKPSIRKQRFHPTEPRVDSSTGSAGPFTTPPQPPCPASSRLLPTAESGAGGCSGSGLPPPHACASPMLARSRLLAFPGTCCMFLPLAACSCLSLPVPASRLVFLANPCRVKLFNNIFGCAQAAGGAQPSTNPAQHHPSPNLAALGSLLRARLRAGDDPTS